MTFSAEGKGGAFRSLPQSSERVGIFLMRFALNGTSSKLDFDDVQLMTVSVPEIKMAAIYRKQV